MGVYKIQSFAKEFRIYFLNSHIFMFTVFSSLTKKNFLLKDFTGLSLYKSSVLMTLFSFHDGLALRALRSFLELGGSWAIWRHPSIGRQEPGSSRLVQIILCSGITLAAFHVLVLVHGCRKGMCIDDHDIHSRNCWRASQLKFRLLLL